MIGYKVHLHPTYQIISTNLMIYLIRGRLQHYFLAIASDNRFQTNQNTEEFTLHIFY